MVAPLCNIINDMRLKLMALKLELGNEQNPQAEGIEGEGAERVGDHRGNQGRDQRRSADGTGLG